MSGADAAKFIQLLNGQALLVHPEAHLVKMEDVVIFGLDGKIVPVLFAATGDTR